MKITDVKALHLRLPVVREIADGTQDCLIVEVQTDSGLVGLGEVVSGSYVARAVIEAPRSAPFRHGLAEILIGMDPLDTEAAFKAMTEGTYWYGPGGVARHAISGIDMALWDIKGKAANLPIRRLLSLDPIDVIPAYASILWPNSPDEVADSAAEFLEKGYRSVKYGWAPMGPDPSLDVNLVDAARQALGADIQLMIDAGRAWDAETAFARACAFAPFDLTWLEEPLKPYDLTGFVQLCAKSPLPIATGEVLALTEEFDPLIELAKVQIIQPDLGRIGGFTQAQKLAERCRKSGKTRPVPHAYGTGVLLSASAQWAATLNEPLTEYTRAPSPLAQELAIHEMRFENGSLHLSNQPGLGVDLNYEIVNYYRMS